MAKTKDGKKIVSVRKHERSKPSGGKTNVKAHKRSTPNISPKREKQDFLQFLQSIFKR